MQDLIQILSVNRVNNISLINFIRQYGISSVIQIGDSLMIRGFSDRPWIFFSSDSKVEFMELTRLLTPEDLNFASIKDWMIPYILKHGNLKWQLSCLKLYYPEESIFTKNIKHDVVNINENEAEFILKHYDYSEFVNLDYVKERLKNGLALGIYYQAELAGFIMTHDDGAMGFLTVLPEHRRKGLAKDLTAEIIWRLRANGDLPFVQIKEDNCQSINLAKQFGFVIDKKIYWVGLEIPKLPKLLYSTFK